MPAGDAEILRPSVLDRLRDEDGQGSYGSVSEYRCAVLRDVEWLLNHRRTTRPAPESCPEVRRSVYHYGLPDLTAVSAESGHSLTRVCRMIEETLRTFEPRLEGPSVRLAGDEASGRGVHFVIEGLLRMDPQPELIRFDTVLEAGGGSFTVSPHA